MTNCFNCNSCIYYLIHGNWCPLPNAVAPTRQEQRINKNVLWKKKIRQKVSIKRFFFSCLYNCCCFYVEGIPNKRRRRRRDKSSILFVSYAFCGLCAAKKRTLKKKGKHTKTNSYPFEAAPFLLRVVSCAQLRKKTLKEKGSTLLLSLRTLLGPFKGYNKQGKGHSEDMSHTKEKITTLVPSKQILHLKRAVCGAWLRFGFTT